MKINLTFLILILNINLLYADCEKYFDKTYARCTPLAADGKDYGMYKSSIRMKYFLNDTYPHYVVMLNVIGIEIEKRVFDFNSQSAFEGQIKIPGVPTKKYKTTTSASCINGELVEDLTVHWSDGSVLYKNITKFEGNNLVRSGYENGVFKGSLTCERVL